MVSYIKKCGYGLPTLFSFLKDGYPVAGLRKDVAAGVTVGIVALPLAMAFAIASGATPQAGLATAIIAGFIISAFGGTRFQIGGPTGAFVVIISGVIARHGYEGLVVATILAGLMLVIMGLFGLGRLLQYIPYPVTAGFTTGIGTIIFITQIKDFFGFTFPTSPSGVVEIARACFDNVASLHLPTLGIGLLTMACMLGVRRFYPRVPAPIVGIVVATLACLAFGVETETIGSRFGGIPSSLPTLTPFWNFNFSLADILPDALTIALLAGIESLLSATVADGMSGDKHNPSTELVAQGMANVGCALFGGLPATGAIARTATNIRSGAYSPVSGIIHALTVLLFILVCTPLAARIPLASLSAVLMIVAWDMSELHKVRRLLRAPKSDSSVMIIAFGLTVFVDITVAVQVGVVLAALLFMKRMSELSDITDIDSGLPEEETHDELSGNEQVVVYEVNGPLFFGFAQRFVDVLNFTRKRPKILVLCMRNVPVMDASGLEALETVIRRARSLGIHVMLSGVNERTRHVMQRMGTEAFVGEENIFPDFSAAVSKIVADRRLTS